MYCGQCGKKVMENMLYCPFCGSPIVIPEQDEPAAEAVKAQFAPAAAPESEEIRQVSLFDDDFAREAPDESLEEDVREEEEIPFEPLRFSFDELVEPEADSAAEEEISTGEESVSEQPAPEPAEETPAPELAPEPEQQVPVSEPKIRPEKRRPEAGRKREAKTLIPVKDVDVDNLFMDEESLEPEDEYDLDDDDYDSGFDQEFADCMATLCGHADVIVPNLSEAAFMLHKPYLAAGEYNEQDIRDLLKDLTGLGAKIAVLTGVSLEKGKLGVMGYDSVRDEYFSYYTKHLPVSFHGTGDVFASTCVGAIALEKPLLEALSIAADYTVDCIQKTVDDPKPNWYGVNFEQALAGLIKRLNP